MAIEKTAMITGAAMGMGALMARTLADRGWTVFAGVLPGADLSELAEHPNITAVDQDVTSDASVNASAETVSTALGGRPLGLLVNNAGVANVGIGVVEGLDIAKGQVCMDINLWGQVRMCQAFLPMIRAGAPHSRIINYASGAVRANPAASGSYNMSKHAVEGLTKTLRNELAPFGIEVTSIEPGAVHTNMTAGANETTKAIWTSIPQEVADVYSPHLHHTTTEKMVEQIEGGNDPQYIVDEVLALLDKKTWNPSYLVGKDVKAMKPMLALLPERMFEKIIQKAVGIPQYKG